MKPRFDQNHFWPHSVLLSFLYQGFLIQATSEGKCLSCFLNFHMWAIETSKN